jgi:transposase-like protein
MLIYQKEETKDREQKTKHAIPKSIEDMPDSWRADPLEALARQGAQKMLAAALEEEVEAYLGRSRYERSDEFRGHRNGYGKERRVTLGCGTIPVRVPRVRDLPEQQEPFESQHLASYQRRSRTVSDLFPKLFVEGLATRDFEPALRCLLGEDAALSPATVSRINKQFKAEYDEWSKRRLEGHRVVYSWADGIYLKAGVGKERAAMLIIIGADTDGTKVVLALQEGYRESTDSWKDVLLDLKKRGLRAPALLCGDGSLGLWAAAAEVWPATLPQRCWNHKVCNILESQPTDRSVWWSSAELVYAA